MEAGDRQLWKEKLEESFRIPDGKERNRLLDEQTDELWEIGPIIVRCKNSRNCPDRCCERDQLVLEEYESRHYAQCAVTFGDNVIKPLWQIILEAEAPTE